MIRYAFRLIPVSGSVIESRGTYQRKEIAERFAEALAEQHARNTRADVGYVIVTANAICDWRRGNAITPIRTVHYKEARRLSNG